MSPSRPRIPSTFWNLAVAGVALLLATPATAYGYADPGTGSFIYQAAYAAFLGGAYYLRKFLNRLFRRSK